MTDTQNLNAALELAAATPLVRKGVDVENAYKATQEWTYIGNPIGESPRDPAALFKLLMFTMLIHYSGENARVLPVELGRGGFHLGPHVLFAYGHPVPTAPTVVHLNKIDEYTRGVCEEYLRS